MTETPLSNGATPQSDFDSQYRRLLEATGCRTQVELAEILGIRQSSISDAKRRNTIPSDWLVKVFEKKRINPDWIRMGAGSRWLQASSAAGEMPPTVTTVIERRSAEDCSTDELIAEVMRRALKVMG